MGDYRRTFYVNDALERIRIISERLVEEKLSWERAKLYQHKELDAKLKKKYKIKEKP